MDLLKQILTYVVTIALLWAALTYIPRWTSRVQIPSDYSEIPIPNVESYPSYSLEADVPIARLRRGDAVCFRFADSEGNLRDAYGFVAGTPGDSVAIAGGLVQVNGKPDRNAASVGALPDAGPLVVPAQHVYVVTTQHQTDSIVRGPIPAAALRGRLLDFP